MGVSYSVYLGPFIEAPNPKKSSKREFHGCPKHKIPTSDKFCTHCGSPIQLLSVPDMARIELDVYSEFDDRLVDVHSENLPNDKEDCAIFQPNQGNFGKHFSGWDAIIYEMNETIIVDEVARMKTTFAKDIKRLEEIFGKVEVKWGAIAYAS